MNLPTLVLFCQFLQHAEMEWKNKNGMENGSTFVYVHIYIYK